MSRTFAVLLLIFATSCATAEAQHGGYGHWYAGSDYSLGLRTHTYVTPWVWGWPYYGGYGYGGYGYGYGYTYADVIRARGLAARNFARAQIDFQNARSKYIENQKKWLETYYERKRIGEAARRARNEERSASVQRYLARQRNQKLPRLSPDELDPNSGALTWPRGLREFEFSGQRRELEELFALRAQTGTTSDLAKKIYAGTRAMRLKLLDNIRDLPVDDYIDARRFLERMGNEARRAPD
ncbi:MAG: hypothetical protein ACE5KM_09650 [Planctomycetaceae bacterium]